MRVKLGRFLMLLGVLLLAASAAIFLRNETEAKNAQTASRQVLEQMVETAQPSLPQGESLPLDIATPVEYLTQEDLEMAEVEIDGYAYIGYLSIPALELELPIMSDWDYQRLQIAPCRYYGTLRGENLVLMAHNYQKHFGRLSELQESSTVFFVDVDGNATEYEVIAKDVLKPEATEEMVAGVYDLTLFTCTYGGAQRITVYCDKRMDR